MQSKRLVSCERGHLKAETGAIFDCCPGSGNPEAKIRGRDYGSRMFWGGVQVPEVQYLEVLQDNPVPGRNGALGARLLAKCDVQTSGRTH